MLNFVNFLVLATAPCTENWSNGSFGASDQQAFGVNGGRRLQIYRKDLVYCRNLAWAVCEVPVPGTSHVDRVTWRGVLGRSQSP